MLSIDSLKLLLGESLFGFLGQVSPTGVMGRMVGKLVVHGSD